MDKLHRTRSENQYMLHRSTNTGVSNNVGWGYTPSSSNPNKKKFQDLYLSYMSEEKVDSRKILDQLMKTIDRMR